MWTNKQVWEFDQLNEGLTFDAAYVEPGNFSKKVWNSKLVHQDSEMRDLAVRTFEEMLDGKELWIANKGHNKLEEKFIPYIMALLVDLMIDEEICLNFRIEEGCLVASIDNNADIIDCKEFFEEFYHLATGFNYDINTGIPEDETEAEIYLSRLQDEFDEKMKDKLGQKYLPGNNDPETLHAK